MRYSLGQMPDLPGDRMPLGSRESYIGFSNDDHKYGQGQSLSNLESLHEAPVSVVVKVVGILHDICG